jgi:hypothetical protein
VCVCCVYVCCLCVHCDLLVFTVRRCCRALDAQLRRVFGVAIDSEQHATYVDGVSSVKRFDSHFAVFCFCVRRHGV